MGVRKKFLTKLYTILLTRVGSVIYTRVIWDEMSMNLYRTNPRGLVYQLSCCNNPANVDETIITLCSGRLTVDNSEVKPTNKKIVVEIPLHNLIEKWERWKKGKPIQHVFTELNTSQREFLISGLDDNEWEKIFGDDAKGRTRAPDNA